METKLNVGDVVVVEGGKYHGTVRTLLGMPTKPHDDFVVSDTLLGKLAVARVMFHRRASA
jgi:hypothetical protein